METLGRQLYLAYRAMRDRLDEALRAVGGLDAAVDRAARSVGDEPELSQRELADRILVTGSTLTHHLDRLEADGLIARSRDLQRPADRPHLAHRSGQAPARPSSSAIVAAHDRRLQALLAPGDASRARSAARQAAPWHGRVVTNGDAMNADVTNADRAVSTAEAPAIVRTRGLSQDLPRRRRTP